MREGQGSIPVVYVDLSENEEREVLATFDPLTSLATADSDMLQELLSDVNSTNADVQQLMESISIEHGMIPALGEDKPHGTGGKECECPECGYTWTIGAK